MKYSHKRLLLFVLVFLVILVIGCYFFRYMILSNLDGMLGWPADGQLNTLICEHWYGVFQGNEPVRDLRVFYPQKNTLGYSDTLFSYAIPYSIFRFIGFDMFRAMQLVLILFYTIGNIGMFLLLFRKLKRNILASIFGTVMFALSNTYFATGHTQMFLIGLIPWLFILVYGFYENINNSRFKRMLYGVLAIALLGIVTLSGFYTAYFVTLFLVILFGVLCVCSWRANEKPVLRIFLFIRKNWLEVSVYIITGIVVLLPSVWVYLPVMREQGARSLTEVMTMLPIWSDFFNVSFDNLIWGKLLEILFSPSRYMHNDLITGFPFVTLLSFLGCLLYFGKRFRAKDFQFDVRLPLAIGVSISIVMLLILRIFDFSFWIILYTLIPGTSALRAISRYNMFLSLPMGIVLAFGAEALLSRWKTRGSVKPILISVILLFFISENTMTVTRCPWSISQQREQMRKVAPPPKDCDVFVLLDESENTEKINPYIYQVYAWMIAVKYNLYTVNGYSGNLPLGWEYIWDPNNLSNYCMGIQEWCKTNNLSDIYAYNPISNKWIPNALTQSIPKLIKKIIPELDYSNRINVKNANFAKTLVFGWSFLEGWGVWSDGSNAALRFFVNTKGQGVRVRIGGNVFHDGKGLKVSILANGQHIKDDLFLDISSGYNIDIPKNVMASGNNILTLEFKIANPKSPLEFGQSKDPRKLGIGLMWFEIQSFCPNISIAI